jgi:hypothetical protein
MMTTLVRRTTVAAIGATSIMCEAATSNREDPDHYDGKSASYMYDKRFHPGPDLRYSELSQFTPQGLTYLEGLGRQARSVAGHGV